MTKTHSALVLAFFALASASPAAAQAANGPAEPRVKQVIVYGSDPCPISEGDEILVCARQGEEERYRIPKELRREEIGSTKNESWTSRVRSIEYVGASGTQSCSPVGAGGFTGCFSKIAKEAKAERQAMGDKSWSELVAAARAKRLGTIDKDSEEIEAQAKAEEKAKADAAARAGAAEAPATGAPATEAK